MDKEPHHPRVARTPFENLVPRLQDVMRARVTRLGCLGEFFQAAAYPPDILTPFLVMIEASPDRVTEVDALAVARLIGKASGSP